MIGNPPYQQEGIGHNTKTPPVYNLYIDAAERLGVVSVLIHPARFLFNAGSTPKPWNQKMLSDIHFKVLEYEPDSKKWFQNVDIKGGMAITYHDSESVFTPIGTFVPFKELRSILSKTKEKTPESIMFSVYSPVGYKFTQKMHDDYPQIAQMLSKGNEFEVKTNVLQKLDNIVFFNDKPTDEYEYVQIYGLEKGKRLFKWIRREYISVPDNFQSYKVFLPEANGSGAIGEILSTPVVGQPIVGHTQTFISIGNFNNLSSAKCLLKYIKTKFARVMLGTLKTTQHNSISTWANVPLQDFTSNSDIDWSKSIPEIDQQLYRKYGLSPEEIDFIETHVKEMD
ncbi:Eco57I restriction-modification methylase domain-containing protein [uncultured Faecalibaculum sp.]|uniref:Eco57I restriction-modification methylase domain-containing protein n=1 Tax=uncultured Faecalibaculum sp. TaxID=1729681 RepID=UPI00272E9E72|nr:Eco57I restriction-modification methylase domain-containing protein [uncultured Faecalibaculum sp.]